MGDWRPNIGDIQPIGWMGDGMLDKKTFESWNFLFIGAITFFILTGHPIGW